MRSVLYFPDGNRRYSEKNNVSLLDSYVIGIDRSLRLFSEYFLKEKDFDLFIFVVYTYVREDSSYDDVCQACEICFERFNKDNFFKKNKINFEIISNSGDFPEKLMKTGRELSDSNKDNGEKKVIFLLGYSMEKDFNESLSKNHGNFKELKENLCFSDIELVIRNCEMRLSDGPTYSMGKSQIIKIDKLNPEVEKKDLEKLWKNYVKIKKYRENLS